MEDTRAKNVGFGMEIGGPNRRIFGLGMCLTLGILVSRLLLFFIGFKCIFSTLIQDGAFVRLEASLYDWELKDMSLPQKGLTLKPTSSTPFFFNKE